MTRRALLAVFAVFFAACGVFLGPDPSTGSAAMFDQLWKDVDLHYSFFDVKHINWDSLGAVYRAHALAADNTDALLTVLLQLLGNLRDEHVVLDIDGNDYPTAASPYSNSFDPTITFSKYVTSVGGYSSGIDYGLVTSTVGYIRFQTFEGSDWSSEVDTTPTLRRVPDNTFATRASLAPIESVADSHGCYR